jgi:hypothetical protein
MCSILMMLGPHQASKIFFRAEQSAEPADLQLFCPALLTRSHRPALCRFILHMVLSQ